MDVQRDAHYPLIIFPSRERSERQNRGGGPSNLRFPSANRQRQRLGPQFNRLQEQFNAAVQANLQGVDPDLVLVIEIAGSVTDFFRAASRIEGLEWIGEWEADDLDPTADFSTERDGERVAASLFLMFSNQHAMREVLSLWRRYTGHPSEAFPHGLAPWKAVFAQLHNIRLWDERDRVSSALIEDWDYRIQIGADQVPFEAELWYFHQPDKRTTAERDVRSIIEGSGGSVTGQCIVEEIEYHAIVGSLPARAIRDVYAQRNLQLFKTREVMYVRPVAQAFVPNPTGDVDVLEIAAPRPLPREDQPPVVAVLDGMPMENHPLLDGRLIVDDPEGWANGIPVADRFHGTAMASIVIHGDLTRQEPPLSRQIYVRPILQPDRTGSRGAPRESARKVFCSLTFCIAR